MLIKDINFFARYNEEQKREKNISKQTVIQVAIIASIVIVTGVSSSVLQVMNMEAKGQIDSINAYINSKEVANKSYEVAKKQEVLDNVTAYYNAIEAANYKLSTIVRPDKSLINSITSVLPIGMVITQFTINGGTVSINCKSDQEAKIAQYVHQLRSVETIFNVTYTGYTKNEADYITSIQIILNSPEVQDATHS